MKATFFITYIMVDGWSGIAAEIVRLAPLIVYHLKNAFLVKTEKDREEAMDAGSLTFSISEPRIQLYFLLGLVYAAVTPILLPFIVVFFAFAYVVFRHQVYILASYKPLLISARAHTCLRYKVGATLNESHERKYTYICGKNEKRELYIIYNFNRSDIHV